MTNASKSPRQHDEEPTADERVEAAQLYVQQLRAFYIHGCVFAATMVVIFVVNLLTNLSEGIADEWGAWWSIWALLGWGIGIAIHGLVVRLNRPPSSSSTWEQRQVDKTLSR